MKKEHNAEIGNEIEKTETEADEPDCEKQAEALTSKKKEKKRYILVNMKILQNI